MANRALLIHAHSEMDSFRRSRRCGAISMHGAMPDCSRTLDVWSRSLMVHYSLQEWKDTLWAKFYTGAPARQRQSVEQYKIVKRA